MANDDTPFGLKPHNTPYCGLQTEECTIAASYAQNIWLNMPVVRHTDGSMLRATVGAGNYIYGVVQGLADADGVPKKYFASGTAEEYTCLVCTDPDQLYEIQEDSDGGNLALTARGALIDLIGYGGSTGTGVSTCELDTSSLAGSSLCQVRIIRDSPNINNTVGSSWSKWLVKIEYGQGRASQLGAAI